MHDDSEKFTRRPKCRPIRESNRKAKVSNRKAKHAKVSNRKAKHARKYDRKRWYLSAKYDRKIQRRKLDRKIQTRGVWQLMGESINLCTQLQSTPIVHCRSRPFVVLSALFRFCCIDDTPYCSGAVVVPSVVPPVATIFSRMEASATEAKHGCYYLS